MSGIVLWITGLPGSGKSSLADEIKKAFPRFVVLRMDELRELATPDPTYSESERSLLYRSLVFTAIKLSILGHNVIIDATGNLRAFRQLARKYIPGFMEIYLKCPVDVCEEREESREERRHAPSNIYKKARAGWPVPGISAPYEEPLNPELTIDTSENSIEKAAAYVIELLKSRGFAL